LGIDKENKEREFYVNGADMVVKDITEIDIAAINNWFLEWKNYDSWSISYHDYN